MNSLRCPVPGAQRKRQALVQGPDAAGHPLVVQAPDGLQLGPRRGHVDGDQRSAIQAVESLATMQDKIPLQRAGGSCVSVTLLFEGDRRFDLRGALWQDRREMRGAFIRVAYVRIRERNMTKGVKPFGGFVAIFAGGFRLARRLSLAVSAIATMCAVSGCSIPFPVYSVSGRNVGTIRTIPNTIKLGQFSGEQKSVWCRLQPISPEGGVTFASYIKNAFNDEIIIAGVTPTQGSIELNGTLRDIDVDCGMGSASWVIEMEFTLGAQPPFTVRTSRAFEGSFAGAVVGARAYQAFVPTVQDLVNDVLMNPAFQAAARVPNPK
jgi:hypothetical protein